MTEKKYTAPCTKIQIATAQVGAVFIDQGVKMQITRVGQAYIDPTDNKPIFDSWAVPVVEKQK